MAHHDRIDFTEEAIVLVGEDDQRFVCHQNLLSASSPFFLAATAKDPGKIIRLPEQDPTAFSIYLNWRYTGSLDLFDGDPAHGVETASDGLIRQKAGKRWHNLFNAYALGDMLQDSTFCNTLIDAFVLLVDTTGHYPPPSVVNPVFRSLSDLSKLQKVFIHKMAFRVSFKTLEENLDLYLAEVWKEIALLSVKERERMKDYKLTQAQGKCFFHVHREGEDKCT